MQRNILWFLQYATLPPVVWKAQNHRWHKLYCIKYIVCVCYNVSPIDARGSVMLNVAPVPGPLLWATKGAPTAFCNAFYYR